MSMSQPPVTPNNESKPKVEDVDDDLEETKDDDKKPQVIQQMLIKDLNLTRNWNRNYCFKRCYSG